MCHDPHAHGMVSTLLLLKGHFKEHIHVRMYVWMDGWMDDFIYVLYCMYTHYVLSTV